MHVNPDLLALLALGEPLDSVEERTHVTECAACQEDLAALRAVVGVGRRTSEQDVLLAPPPQVWERISNELQLQSRSHHSPGSPVNGSSVTAISSVLPGRRPVPEQSRAPGADGSRLTPAAGGASAGTRVAGGPADATPERSAGVSPRPSSRGLRAASLALAAVLALVVGIGLGANLDSVLPGRSETAAVQLNALPPWPGSTGEATIEEDRDGNRTLVVAISSPQPATGPREVWLTNTAAEPMVAVGFLQGDSGRFPIAPELDPATYYLVDISQEPAGDENPGHSGRSMLRGRLPL